MITIVLISILLIYLSYQDYKNLSIQSTWLVLLLVLDCFHIVFSGNIVDRILFSFSVLGVTVAVELIMTTMYQSVISKFDKKYENAVFLGEADYFLFFTGAVLSNDIRILLTSLLIFFFVSTIISIVNSNLLKQDKYYYCIAMPAYPLYTIALIISFIYYKF